MALISRGLLRRLRRRESADPTVAPDRREARQQTLAHFRQFVATRPAVEGYIEPATANDPVTLVLIARSGEWTRRRVPDARAARALGRELQIPVYDVLKTGYPPQMRRWNSANRHRHRT
ncbi:hypothetical protein GCM10023169_39450 [Georgenia halophila]|uniref:Oxidoreductase n=1 Tax=Georgenia halophila TaxID=620889 RepID=A0ABP8LNA5_9MICO